MTAQGSVGSGALRAIAVARFALFQSRASHDLAHIRARQTQPLLRSSSWLRVELQAAELQAELLSSPVCRDRLPDAAQHDHDQTRQQRLAPRGPALHGSRVPHRQNWY